MPKYHVTIYYRNKAGKPKTLMQEINGRHEDHAAQKVEAALREVHPAVKIDGGSVMPIKNGKIVRPRSKSTALRRRVLVIVPSIETDVDETLSFIQSELDRTVIHTTIYQCSVNASALDELNRGGFPSVAIGRKL